MSHRARTKGRLCSAAGVRAVRATGPVDPVENNRALGRIERSRRIKRING